MKSPLRPLLAALALLFAALPSAQLPVTAQQPLQATLVLDWFPNTNHAGIYLAQANGWYEQAGLNLRIETPSDVGAATKLVANNSAEIGVGYQAGITISRALDIPVVSVGAIVQHNLGAFAAKQESGITRPADFVGKRYGSSGIPQSMAQLRTVVQCDGADPGAVEEVTVGQGIAQALLANRVDFMAMLWTWEGIQLEMQGTPLNYMHYQDWCLPDTYNLVFMSSERTIQEKPEVLTRFLDATRRGYEAAVVDPVAASAALLAAAPDLSPALVTASLDRLSPYFIAGAPHWGHQDPQRWTDYAAWMYASGLIQKEVDGSQAMTGAFLR